MLGIERARGYRDHFGTRHLWNSPLRFGNCAQHLKRPFLKTWIISLACPGTWWLAVPKVINWTPWSRYAAQLDKSKRFSFSMHATLKNKGSRAPRLQRVPSSLPIIMRQTSLFQTRIVVVKPNEDLAVEILIVCMFCWTSCGLLRYPYPTSCMGECV